jgi:hypothetical protein
MFPSRSSLEEISPFTKGQEATPKPFLLKYLKPSFDLLMRFWLFSKKIFTSVLDEILSYKRA